MTVSSSQLTSLSSKQLVEKAQKKVRNCPPAFLQSSAFFWRAITNSLDHLVEVSLDIPSKKFTNPLSQFYRGNLKLVIYDGKGTLINPPEGTIAAIGSIIIVAKNIINDSASILSLSSVTIHANKLFNRKGKICSEQEMAITARGISNKDGVIASRESQLTISGECKLVNTRGLLFGKKGVTAEGEGEFLNVTGHIHSSDGPIKFLLQELANNEGVIVGTSAQIKARGVDNNLGKIRITGNAEFTLTDFLINTSGIIDCSGLITILEGKLSHQSGIISGHEGIIAKLNGIASGSSQFLSKNGPIQLTTYDNLVLEASLKAVGQIELCSTTGYAMVRNGKIYTPSHAIAITAPNGRVILDGSTLSAGKQLMLSGTQVSSTNTSYTVIDGNMIIEGSSFYGKESTITALMGEVITRAGQWIQLTHHKVAARKIVDIAQQIGYTHSLHSADRITIEASQRLSIDQSSAEAAHEIFYSTAGEGYFSGTSAKAPLCIIHVEKDLWMKNHKQQGQGLAITSKDSAHVSGLVMAEGERLTIGVLEGSLTFTSSEPINVKQTQLESPQQVEVAHSSFEGNLHVQSGLTQRISDNHFAQGDTVFFSQSGNIHVAHNQWKRAGLVNASANGGSIDFEEASGTTQVFTVESKSLFVRGSFIDADGSISLQSEGTTLSGSGLTSKGDMTLWGTQQISVFNDSTLKSEKTLSVKSDHSVVLNNIEIIARETLTCAAQEVSVSGTDLSSQQKLTLQGEIVTLESSTLTVKGRKIQIHMEAQKLKSIKSTLTAPSVHLSSQTAELYGNKTQAQAVVWLGQEIKGSGNHLKTRTWTVTGKKIDLPQTITTDDMETIQVRSDGHVNLSRSHLEGTTLVRSHQGVDLTGTLVKGDLDVKAEANIDMSLLEVREGALKLDSEMTLYGPNMYVRTENSVTLRGNQIVVPHLNLETDQYTELTGKSSVNLTAAQMVVKDELKIVAPNISQNQATLSAKSLIEESSILISSKTTIFAAELQQIASNHMVLAESVAQVTRALVRSSPYISHEQALSTAGVHVYQATTINNYKGRLVGNLEIAVVNFNQHHGRLEIGDYLSTLQVGNLFMNEESVIKGPGDLSITHTAPYQGKGPIKVRMLKIDSRSSLVSDHPIKASEVYFSSPDTIVNRNEIHLKVNGEFVSRRVQNLNRITSKGNIEIAQDHFEYTDGVTALGWLRYKTRYDIDFNRPWTAMTPGSLSLLSTEGNVRILSPLEIHGNVALSATTEILIQAPLNAQGRGYMMTTNPGQITVDHTYVYLGNGLTASSGLIKSLASEVEIKGPSEVTCSEFIIESEAISRMRNVQFMLCTIPVVDKYKITKVSKWSNDGPFVLNASKIARNTGELRARNMKVLGVDMDNKDLTHVYTETVQVGTHNNSFCGINTGSDPIYEERRYVVVDVRAEMTINELLEFYLQGILSNSGKILAESIVAEVAQLLNGIFTTVGLAQETLGQIHAKNIILRIQDVLNNHGSIIADNALYGTMRRLFNRTRVTQWRVQVAETKRWNQSSFHWENNDMADPTAQIIGETVELEVEEDAHNIGALIRGSKKTNLHAKSIENRALALSKIVHLKTGRPMPWQSATAWTVKKEYVPAQILSGGSMTIHAEEEIENIASFFMAWKDLMIVAGSFTQRTLFNTYDIVNHRDMCHYIKIQKIQMAESNTISMAGDFGLFVKRGAHIEGPIGSVRGDVHLRAGGEVRFQAVTVQVINVIETLKFATTSIGIGPEVWTEATPATKRAQDLNKDDFSLTVLSSKSTTFTDSMTSVPKVIAGRHCVVESDTAIKGEGVQFEVGGDLTTRSPDTAFTEHQVLEWMEQHGWTLGVTFPGSKALEAAVNGEYAAAGNALLRMDPLINSMMNLAQAGDGMDYVTQGAVFGAQTFSAASHVASGLNQGAGAGGIIGSRLGITDMQGNFKPTIGVRFGVFQKESSWTVSHPTQFQVGGNHLSEFTNLYMRGVQMLVGGDATFRGEKIVWEATVDTQESSSSDVGVTVSFGAGGWGVGMDAYFEDAEGRIHRNTYVNVGGKLTMVAHDSIIFKGAKANADEIEVETEYMEVISLADTHKSSHVGGSVSTGGDCSVSVGSENKAVVTQASGLTARQGGRIKATTLHTAGASFENIEIDAEHVTQSTVDEHNEGFSISASVSFKSDQGLQAIGSLDYRSHIQRGFVQTTSVNGNGADFGWNTDPSQIHVITEDEKTHLATPIIGWNSELLAKDWEEIRTAFNGGPASSSAVQFPQGRRDETDHFDYASLMKAKQEKPIVKKTKPRPPKKVAAKKAIENRPFPQGRKVVASQPSTTSENSMYAVAFKEMREFIRTNPYIQDTRAAFATVGRLFVMPDTPKSFVRDAILVSGALARSADVALKTLYLLIEPVLYGANQIGRGVLYLDHRFPGVMESLSKGADVLNRSFIVYSGPRRVNDQPDPVDQAWQRALEVFQRTYVGAANYVVAQAGSIERYYGIPTKFTYRLLGDTTHVAAAASFIATGRYALRMLSAMRPSVVAKLKPVNAKPIDTKPPVRLPQSPVIKSVDTAFARAPMPKLRTIREPLGQKSTFLSFGKGFNRLKTLCVVAMIHTTSPTTILSKFLPARAAASASLMLRPRLIKPRVVRMEPTINRASTSAYVAKPEALAKVKKVANTQHKPKIVAAKSHASDVLYSSIPASATSTDGKERVITDEFYTFLRNEFPAESLDKSEEAAKEKLTELLEKTHSDLSDPITLIENTLGIVIPRAEIERTLSYSNAYVEKLEIGQGRTFAVKTLEENSWREIIGHDVLRKLDLEHLDLPTPIAIGSDSGNVYFIKTWYEGTTIDILFEELQACIPGSDEWNEKFLDILKAVECVGKGLGEIYAKTKGEGKVEGIPLLTHFLNEVEKGNLEGLGLPKIKYDIEVLQQLISQVADTVGELSYSIKDVGLAQFVFDKARSRVGLIDVEYVVRSIGQSGEPITHRMEDYIEFWEGIQYKSIAIGLSEESRERILNAYQAGYSQTSSPLKDGLISSFYNLYANIESISLLLGIENPDENVLRQIEGLIHKWNKQAADIERTMAASHARNERSVNKPSKPKTMAEKSHTSDVLYSEKITPCGDSQDKVSNKHLRTMETLFNPTTRIMVWRDVVSMMQYFGVTLKMKKGVRGYVEYNGVRMPFRAPHGTKDLKQEFFNAFREFLREVKLTPETVAKKAKTITMEPRKSTSVTMSSIFPGILLPFEKPLKKVVEIVKDKISTYGTTDTTAPSKSDHSPKKTSKNQSEKRNTVKRFLKEHNFSTEILYYFNDYKKTPFYSYEKHVALQKLVLAFEEAGESLGRRHAEQLVLGEPMGYLHKLWHDHIAMYKIIDQFPVYRTALERMKNPIDHLGKFLEFISTKSAIVSTVNPFVELDNLLEEFDTHFSLEHIASARFLKGWWSQLEGEDWKINFILHQLQSLHSHFKSEIEPVIQFSLTEKKLIPKFVKKYNKLITHVDGLCKYRSNSKYLSELYPIFAPVLFKGHDAINYVGRLTLQPNSLFSCETGKMFIPVSMYETLRTEYPAATMAAALQTAQTTLFKMIPNAEKITNFWGSSVLAQTLEIMSGLNSRKIKDTVAIDDDLSLLKYGNQSIIVKHYPLNRTNEALQEFFGMDLCARLNLDGIKVARPLAFYVEKEKIVIAKTNSEGMSLGQKIAGLRKLSPDSKEWKISVHLLTKEISEWAKHLVELLNASQTVEECSESWPIMEKVNRIYESLGKIPALAGTRIRRIDDNVENIQWLIEQLKSEPISRSLGFSNFFMSLFSIIDKKLQILDYAGLTGSTGLNGERFESYVSQWHAAKSAMRIEGLKYNLPQETVSHFTNIIDFAFEDGLTNTFSENLHLYHELDCALDRIDKFLRVAVDYRKDGYKINTKNIVNLIGDINQPLIKIKAKAESAQGITPIASSSSIPKPQVIPVIQRQSDDKNTVFDMMKKAGRDLAIKQMQTVDYGDYIKDAHILQYELHQITLKLSQRRPQILSFSCHTVNVFFELLENIHTIQDPVNPFVQLNSQLKELKTYLATGHTEEAVQQFLNSFMEGWWSQLPDLDWVRLYYYHQLKELVQYYKTEIEGICGGKHTKGTPKARLISSFIKAFNEINKGTSIIGRRHLSLGHKWIKLPELFMPIIDRACKPTKAQPKVMSCSDGIETDDVIYSEPISKSVSAQSSNAIFSDEIQQLFSEMAHTDIQTFEGFAALNTLCVTLEEAGRTLGRRHMSELVRGERVEYSAELPREIDKIREELRALIPIAAIDRASASTKQFLKNVSTKNSILSTINPFVEIDRHLNEMEQFGLKASSKEALDFAKATFFRGWWSELEGDDWEFLYLHHQLQNMVADYKSKMAKNQITRDFLLQFNLLLSCANKLGQYRLTNKWVTKKKRGLPFVMSVDPTIHHMISTVVPEKKGLFVSDTGRIFIPDSIYEMLFNEHPRETLTESLQAAHMSLCEKIPKASVFHNPRSDYVMQSALKVMSGITTGGEGRLSKIDDNLSLFDLNGESIVIQNYALSHAQKALQEFFGMDLCKRLNLKSTRVAQPLAFYMENDNFVIVKTNSHGTTIGNKISALWRLSEGSPELEVCTYQVTQDLEVWSQAFVELIEASQVEERCSQSWPIMDKVSRIYDTLGIIPELAGTRIRKIDENIDNILRFIEKLKSERIIHCLGFSNLSMNLFSIVDDQMQIHDYSDLTSATGLTGERFESPISQWYAAKSAIRMKESKNKLPVVTTALFSRIIDHAFKKKWGTTFSENLHLYHELDCALDRIDKILRVAVSLRNNGYKIDIHVIRNLISDIDRPLMRIIEIVEAGSVAKPRVQKPTLSSSISEKDVVSPMMFAGQGLVPKKARTMAEKIHNSDVIYSEKIQPKATFTAPKNVITDEMRQVMTSNPQYLNLWSAIVTEWLTLSKLIPNYSHIPNMEDQWLAAIKDALGEDFVGNRPVDFTILKSIEGELVAKLDIGEHSFIVKSSPELYFFHEAVGLDIMSKIGLKNLQFPELIALGMGEFAGFVIKTYIEGHSIAELVNLADKAPFIRMADQEPVESLERKALIKALRLAFERYGAALGELHKKTEIRAVNIEAPDLVGVLDHLNPILLQVGLEEIPFERGVLTDFARLVHSKMDRLSRDIYDIHLGQIIVTVDSKLALIDCEFVPLSTGPNNQPCGHPFYEYCSSRSSVDAETMGKSFSDQQIDSFLKSCDKGYTAENPEPYPVELYHYVDLKVPINMLIEEIENYLKPEENGTTDLSVAMDIIPVINERIQALEASSRRPIAPKGKVKNLLASLLLMQPVMEARAADLAILPQIVSGHEVSVGTVGSSDDKAVLKHVVTVDRIIEAVKKNKDSRDEGLTDRDIKLIIDSDLIPSFGKIEKIGFQPIIDFAKQVFYFCNDMEVKVFNPWMQVSVSIDEVEPNNYPTCFYLVKNKDGKKIAFIKDVPASELIQEAMSMAILHKLNLKYAKVPTILSLGKYALGNDQRGLIMFEYIEGDTLAHLMQSGKCEDQTIKLLGKFLGELGSRITSDSVSKKYQYRFTNQLVSMWHEAKRIQIKWGLTPFEFSDSDIVKVIDDFIRNPGPGGMVHGDMHLGNVMYGPSGLVVIDTSSLMLSVDIAGKPYGLSLFDKKDMTMSLGSHATGAEHPGIEVKRLIDLFTEGYQEESKPITPDADRFVKIYHLLQLINIFDSSLIIEKLIKDLNQIMNKKNNGTPDLSVALDPISNIKERIQSPGTSSRHPSTSKGKVKSLLTALFLMQPVLEARAADLAILPQIVSGHEVSVGTVGSSDDKAALKHVVTVDRIMKAVKKNKDVSDENLTERDIQLIMDSDLIPSFGRFEEISFQPIKDFAKQVFYFSSDMKVKVFNPMMHISVSIDAVESKNYHARFYHVKNKDGKPIAFIKDIPASELIPEAMSMAFLHKLNLKYATVPTILSLGKYTLGDVQRGLIMFEHVEGDSLTNLMKAGKCEDQTIKLFGKLLGELSSHRSLQPVSDIYQNRSINQFLSMWQGAKNKGSWRLTPFEFSDVDIVKVFTGFARNPGNGGFVHGDMHLGNVMYGPRGLVMIDAPSLMKSVDIAGAPKGLPLFDKSVAIFSIGLNTAVAELSQFETKRLIDLFLEGYQEESKPVTPEADKFVKVFHLLQMINSFYSASIIQLLIKDLNQVMKNKK